VSCKLLITLCWTLNKARYQHGYAAYTVPFCYYNDDENNAGSNNSKLNVV